MPVGPGVIGRHWSSLVIIGRHRLSLAVIGVQTHRWRSELFPVCRSKHRFVKAFLIGYSAWRFEGGVSNRRADWVISNVRLQA